MSRSPAWKTSDRAAGFCGRARRFGRPVILVGVVLAFVRSTCDLLPHHRAACDPGGPCPTLALVDVTASTKVGAVPRK